MTNRKQRAANEIADLFAAFLIFRDSDLGVEGFRKYLRQVFGPGFDQTISEFIAVFSQRAAGDTKAIH
jgi:hypothetical protein